MQVCKDQILRKNGGDGKDDKQCTGIVNDPRGEEKDNCDWEVKARNKNKEKE